MTSKNYLLKSITGNLRRNFWILVLFFFALFAAGPVRTLVSLDGAKHTVAPYPSGFSLEEYLQWTLWNNISLRNSLVIVLVIACGALAAFSGFWYLYSQEKTDFYHSLPVRREKLFAVQAVSGFLTFLLPYLLNLLIMLAIGTGYGAADWETLKAAGVQFLFVVVFFLAIYAAGILAILLTGNIFGGILGFAALMVYGQVVYQTYTGLNYRFFSTLVPEAGNDLGGFFSPVTAYIQAAGVYGSDTGVLPYLLYGLALAVVLFLADVLIYRLRPSESFHRMIAFPKLEPVVKVCGLLPLVLLAAMLFSSQMYEDFFWLVAGALVLALILSAIYDFLCTMDIRRALRPKVSTGMILAGLILILGGYQMDIANVEGYLPKEEKLASMSVYFPSINGLFSYPENVPMSESASSLKKIRVEDFQDIYELARKGVAYYKEKDGGNAGGTDQGQETMVSVYIGYHLKSGRDVYRLYSLPETEELVENIGAVYDNWEYREKILPTSYIDPKKIQGINTFSFSENGKPLELSESSADTLLKTYKGELENLAFAQIRKEKVVGYMELQEKAGEDLQTQGYYLSEEGYTYSYSLPVYESFEKTRDLLAKMGNPLPDKAEEDQVEAIDLSRYVQTDGEEPLYQQETIQDPETVRRLLEQMTFTECRPSVASPVNYEVTVTIRWKDPEKDEVLLNLMEDDSLSDILDQLSQQDPEAY